MPVDVSSTIVFDFTIICKTSVAQIVFNFMKKKPDSFLTYINQNDVARCLSMSDKYAGVAIFA